MGYLDINKHTHKGTLLTINIRFSDIFMIDILRRVYIDNVNFGGGEISIENDWGFVYILGQNECTLISMAIFMGNQPSLVYLCLYTLNTITNLQ